MAEATLDRDLSSVMPSLAEALPDCIYNKTAGSVSFSLEKAYVTLFSDRVWMFGVADDREANEVMGKLLGLIDGLAAAPHR